MNEIEQLLFSNYVLFYADYLSLRETYLPITDICKYYYLLDCPINAAYVVGLEPVYDVENKYYVQSYGELKQIYDKFNFEALSEFIQNLCNIKAIGVVGGDTILKCILLYEDKKVKKKALAVYFDYINNIEYDQEVVEDGEVHIEKCSKYVYHVNQARRNKS